MPNEEKKVVSLTEWKAAKETPPSTPTHQTTVIVNRNSDTGEVVGISINRYPSTDGVDSNFINDTIDDMFAGIATLCEHSQTKFGENPRDPEVVFVLRQDRAASNLYGREQVTFDNALTYRRAFARLAHTLWAKRFEHESTAFDAARRTDLAHRISAIQQRWSETEGFAGTFGEFLIQELEEGTHVLLLAPRDL